MTNENTAFDELQRVPDYHEEVLRTVDLSLSPDDRILLAALGLAGETGEVVDLIKKQRFTPARLPTRANVLEELGDVLWYLTLLADCHGWTLVDVMQANVTKLRQRYPTGFYKEGPAK